MCIHAVIFDMDGVIADTEPVHIAAWQDVLAAEGAEAPADYFAQYVGVGDGEAVGKILADWGLSLDVEEVLDRKFQSFKKIVERDGAHVTPGFFEVTAWLREQGIRMAVATGSARPLANVVLSSLCDSRTGERGKAVFEFLVAREDVACPKPAPDPYALVCSRLALDPSVCLAIEDSPRGIQSARAAGLVCAGLISPFYGPDDLQDANYRIRSLDDIVTARCFNGAA